MDPRIIVRIEITKEAWAQIGRLTQKFGMTQLSMHSRMVEWLSAQPDEIRAAVLQKFPVEVKGNVGGMILKRMQREVSS